MAAWAAGCKSPLPPETAPNFQGANRSILYSLEPMHGKLVASIVEGVPVTNATSPAGPSPEFVGFHVLGETPLNPKQTEEAVKSFYPHLGSWPKGEVSWCAFFPTLGLKIFAQDRTYDLLFCYDCNEIRISWNNTELKLILSGSPRVLNRLLDAANVPRSKRPQ